MHNVVLSPIDPEKLISSISEQVAANILKALSANQTSKEQSDQLLTVQETAEFLALAVPTVYSMVSRGELPVMKRSKRLYFSRLELTDYLKAGRKKSNSEIASEASAFLSNRKKGLSNGK